MDIVIVFAIVAMAGGYLIWRLYEKVRQAKEGKMEDGCASCQGCAGCAQFPPENAHLK